MHIFVFKSTLNYKVNTFFIPFLLKFAEKIPYVRAIKKHRGGETSKAANRNIADHPI